MKTDKNGNHTEIKREQHGIARPVVRTVNGNFFSTPTVCVCVWSGDGGAWVCVHVCVSWWEGGMCVYGGGQIWGLGVEVCV